MTNPELIERVANAIKYSRSDEQGGWNYAAIAAIAAVRSYDCEVGPSEAEIEELLNTWRSDLSHSTEGRVSTALKAAAAERQRRDGEEATNDR